MVTDVQSNAPVPVKSAMQRALNDVNAFRPGRGRQRRHRGHVETGTSSPDPDPGVAERQTVRGLPLATPSVEHYTSRGVE